ncbi:hypothetical protein FOA52_007093 [Chlamydomonas sp. UWO 241]|nr:hypothetical protein FOA52_007093 [Chlamydomonas sp. UWO 241]
MKALRVFTEGTTSLVDAASMVYDHWYPGATLLADGKILIYGGTKDVGDIGAPINSFYEI